MKRATALLIAFACLQGCCQTHMIAERDSARVLVGDLPDIAPLNAVLNHLLQNPDELWLTHGVPIKRVYVVRVTDRWSTHVGHDQLFAEISDWDLDIERLVQEYLAHKRKKYAIPDRFDDERVALVTWEEVEELLSDRVFFNQQARSIDRMYVSFMPPVYFDDYCLVRFGFGPTPHGATGNFLLRRAGDSWEITRKDLVYYA
jgi:hypothetical protein